MKRELSPNQLAKLLKISIANELMPEKVRCPFCFTKTAIRQSQGDWPVVGCRKCGVVVELVVTEQLPEVKRKKK